MFSTLFSVIASQRQHRAFVQRDLLAVCVVQGAVNIEVIVIYRSHECGKCARGMNTSENRESNARVAVHEHVKARSADELAYS